MSFFENLKIWLEPLSNYHIGDKTLYDVVFAFGIFLAIFVGLAIFKFLLVNSLRKVARKTKSNFDDAIVVLIDRIHWAFYLSLSLLFSLRILIDNKTVSLIIEAVLLLIIIFELIKFLQGILDYGLSLFAVRKGGEKGEEIKAASHGIKLLASVLFWTIGIILLLSNLGLDVTSLIAGLGIGGIAVALAAQNILGDMFSSFSIFFDKPFKVGDFIVVDKHMGTVKKIGLKTTRLEAVQGEEIIISNKELTSVRVQNFKRMQRRRVTMNVGVNSDTEVTKLKKINNIVGKIFEGIPLAKLDRCHLVKLGGSSLVYEILYSVNSSKYNDYMDVQQQLNFSLKESFEKEGINFSSS